MFYLLHTITQRMPQGYFTLVPSLISNSMADCIRKLFLVLLISLETIFRFQKSEDYVKMLVQDGYRLIDFT